MEIIIVDHTSRAIAKPVALDSVHQGTSDTAHVKLAMIEASA